MKIKERIKKFFFPPAGSPRWVKIFPYAVLGALTLSIFIAGGAAWEYTNSPRFCGESCHTMPPEYTSYLTSPHARINCTECHLGRGFLATQVSRKIGDLQHVTKTLFKKYEFPIRADDMRPARESCEKCHFPEKFSDDSLRELKEYSTDKFNTSKSTFIVLKTGGGAKRQGLGRGIHWHVENPIYYYATDPEKQNIPYVKVVNEDGTITEYVDLESNFDPDSIDESKLEQMDCITCHNRITHLVNQPEAAVDKLLANGLIDQSIPEFRRQSVEVLRANYPSKESALAGIASLVKFYQTYYPDYYQANQQIVQEAVSALQNIYDQSVFPEQKSDWSTHSDNIGHKYSPGCFRCHDGKHMNTEQDAIRLECNLCHSIPKITGPQDFVTNIELSRGIEPETHKNANWIAMHRDVYDSTCSNCHTTEDAGGTSNTSFCSNSACHGNVWNYAGFDAPALRQVLQAQLPPPAESPEITESTPINWNESVGSLVQSRCGSCHGGDSPIQGLDLTSYTSAMKGSANGEVIIPGDPQGSILVQKQSGAQSHFGQFNPDELQLIVKWIEGGAAEQ